MQSDVSGTIERGIADSLKSDKLSSLNNIESRECSSDKFKGVQQNIYGDYINTRAVIDYVAERDDIAIESMAHVNEGNPRLSVFIAYLPVQEHPAFV